MHPEQWGLCGCRSGGQRGCCNGGCFSIDDDEPPTRRKKRPAKDAADETTTAAVTEQPRPNPEMKVATPEEKAPTPAPVNAPESQPMQEHAPTG